MFCHLVDLFGYISYYFRDIARFGRQGLELGKAGLRVSEQPDMFLVGVKLAGCFESGIYGVGFWFIRGACLWDLDCYVSGLGGGVRWMLDDSSCTASESETRGRAET